MAPLDGAARGGSVLPELRRARRRATTPAGQHGLSRRRQPRGDRADPGSELLPARLCAGALRDMGGVRRRLVSVEVVRRYGLYQMGVVYARSWMVAGTSVGSGTPKNFASYVVQRGV